MMFSRFYHRHLRALIAGALFFLLSLFAINLHHVAYQKVIPAQTTIDYVFPAGSSVKILARDLHAMGIIHQPNTFILLAYLKGDAWHLRAGEYLFTPKMSALQILKKIASGDVVQRNLTFIEGWTFDQMLFTLESNPLLVHNLAGLPAPVVMIALGLPGVNPEGLFFPDTYQYAAGMSDKAILWRAYRKMQTTLLQQWKTRAPNLPYKTPYEALIVASIIEKEAGLENERPLVAGVIERRLQRGIKLAMDSTVIYGLGPNFKGPLTRADLRKETPYNTYMNYGLPPTPIAMPSLASINAALHPAPGDVMYFVSRGNGTQQFSVTYQQQKAAIAKYELHR